MKLTNGQFLLKRTDTRDFVAWMNHSGGFTLRPHQDDVNHVGGRRNSADAFEIVDRHLGYLVDTGCLG